MDGTTDSEPIPAADPSSVEESDSLAQSSLAGLSYWESTATGIGLTYVRERWLENATGQWLSVDPDRSEPRYSYAHNFPTTRTDPSGTQTGDVPKGDFKYLKAGDQVIIQQFATKDERQRDTLIDFLEALRSEYGGQVALGQLNFLADVAGDALQGRIEQKVRQSKSFGIAGEALVRALLMALLAPLPAQFGDFAPDTTDELGEWANGFIHGIAEGLYSLLPEALIDSVIDFFEEMIREHTDIATLLSAAFVRFTHWIAFFNADELTPRQRGEFVGSALISEIALVFIVAGAVEAAVEVYEIGSDLIETTGFGRGIRSRARTYGEQLRTKLASRPKGSKRPVPQQVADLLKTPEARIAAGVPASAVDGIPKHGHMPSLSETVAKADEAIKEKAFVYRVQDGLKQGGKFGSMVRIIIGEHNELVVRPEPFPPGDPRPPRQTRLHVIFDDEARARVYLRDNRPGGYIVSFEVDPEFVKEVRSAAVSQGEAKRGSDRPQRVDIGDTSPDVRTKYNLGPLESSAYGLKGAWIQGLEKAAKPGTGRIFK